MHLKLLLPSKPIVLALQGPHVFATVEHSSRFNEEQYDLLADANGTGVSNESALILLRLYNNRKMVSKEVVPTLFTMKMGDKRLYRVLPTGNLDIELRKTTGPFLSVEYNHPRSEQTIYIDIPESACLVGNELLSSVYVLRYLVHQYDPYVFGLDYKLTIMDKDVNTFELHSNQYIRITDTGYEVV
jgi:hypothetical protein